MDVRNPEHADLLDWKALKSQCDFHREPPGRKRGCDPHRALLAAIKEANAKGRARAEELLMADGGGLACAMRISRLQDHIITILHDFALNHVFNAANTPEASRLGVAAVAAMAAARWRRLGYRPSLPAACQEARLGWPAIEFILYILWDMGLKVGHATRTVKNAFACRRPI